VSAENLPGVQLGNNGASLRIHGERALKTPRAVTPGVPRSATQCAVIPDSRGRKPRLAGNAGFPGPGS
jgi:hypothetical protein